MLSEGESTGHDGGVKNGKEPPCITEHPGVADSRGRKPVQPRLGSCQQTAGRSGTLPHCTPGIAALPWVQAPHAPLQLHTRARTRSHSHSHSHTLQQDPRGKETLDLAGCSQLFWCLESLPPSSQIVTHPVSLRVDACVSPPPSPFLSTSLALSPCTPRGETVWKQSGNQVWREHFIGEGSGQRLLSLFLFF